MERRALLVRVDPDLTAVRFNDATGDEQTEAVPRLGSTRADTSHQRIEDGHLLARWDLGTSILHADLETILAFGDGDLDLRSRLWGGHGGAYEVGDRRSHVCRIDPGHRSRRRGGHPALAPSPSP